MHKGQDQDNFVEVYYKKKHSYKHASASSEISTARPNWNNFKNLL